MFIAITVFSFLIFLALLGIWWELRAFVTVARSGAMRGPIPLPTSAPTGELDEILHRHDGEWHHSGWVRQSSPAWQEAINTPGKAVRKSNGSIEEGVQ